MSKIQVEPAQPKCGKKTPKTDFWTISDRGQRIVLRRIILNWLIFQQKIQQKNFPKKPFEPAQIDFLPKK